LQSELIKLKRNEVMQKPVFLLLILLFVLFGVTGCATSRNVHLSDGWKAYVVSCGGPMLNMGHCVEKAGEICMGRGFRVVNHLGEALPDANAMPTGGLPDLPKSMQELGEYPKRKLLIKCN